MKTWVFRILVNRAKTGGEAGAPAPCRSPRPSARPARSGRPSSTRPVRACDHPLVPVTGRHRRTTGRAPGQVAAAETGRRLTATLDRLPPAPARSSRCATCSWTGAEVCNALGITETNQRVLLPGPHQLRQALEDLHHQPRPPPTPSRSPARRWSRLLTAYLDGALDDPTGSASTPTWACRSCVTTSSSSARRSRQQPSPGRRAPRSWTSSWTPSGTGAPDGRPQATCNAAAAGSGPFHARPTR